MLNIVKKAVKALLSYNIVLPFRKGNRFIFIYHDISNPGDSHYSPVYSTQTEAFKQQLDFYKKHFTLVSLDEIVGDELKNNRNYACLVFDDGFRSVKEVAAPLLKRLDIPFAVFINKMAVVDNHLWVSDLVIGGQAFKDALSLKFGKDDQGLIDSLKESRVFNNDISRFVSEADVVSNVYLTEQDTIDLHRQGVCMGSHTLCHPVLSECDRDTQSREIRGNKEYLDNLLGQDTIHFAFPFGKREHFTNETVSILRETGHKYLYTSNPRSFQQKDIKPTFLIPRIGILDENHRDLMFYVNRQFVKPMNI